MTKVGFGRDLRELESALGYRFADPSLLETALTHRSYANENRAAGVGDNERLEFLGDAVLDLVVGHLLMERFPELGEGELSMSRAHIVSAQGLAAAAKEIGLGEWLRLGRGEERSGGRRKDSLLADALEAIVAAVFSDGGFEAAREVAVRLCRAGVDAAEEGKSLDFKTRLQEQIQAHRHATPEYQVVAESGPDHDKLFEVAVLVDGEEWGRAVGKSKKAAEQQAAERAVGRDADE